MYVTKSEISDLVAYTSLRDGDPRSAVPGLLFGRVHRLTRHRGEVILAAVGRLQPHPKALGLPGTEIEVGQHPIVPDIAVIVPHVGSRSGIFEHPFVEDLPPGGKDLRQRQVGERLLHAVLDGDDRRKLRPLRERLHV